MSDNRFSFQSVLTNDSNGRFIRKLELNCVDYIPHMVLDTSSVTRFVGLVFWIRA